MKLCGAQIQPNSFVEEAAGFLRLGQDVSAEVPHDQLDLFQAALTPRATSPLRPQSVEEAVSAALGGQRVTCTIDTTWSDGLKLNMSLGAS